MLLLKINKSDSVNNSLIFYNYQVLWVEIELNIAYRYIVLSPVKHHAYKNLICF